MQGNFAVKDVRVPEIDVQNTGNLIEGYRKKFQDTEQNLKDEAIEVCNFGIDLNIRYHSIVISFEKLGYLFNVVLFFRLKCF